jgi:hypothetical protein
MPGYNDVDEGSGDSGVIQPGGPSKDAVKKLDQIIQVRQFTSTNIQSPLRLIHSLSEFPHQSRCCDPTSSSFVTCGHLEGRFQESQQMG